MFDACTWFRRPDDAAEEQRTNLPLKGRSLYITANASFFGPDAEDDAAGEAADGAAGVAAGGAADSAAGKAAPLVQQAAAQAQQAAAAGQLAAVGQPADGAQGGSQDDPNDGDASEDMR